MAVTCSKDNVANPESNLRCSQCGSELSLLVVGATFQDRFRVVEQVASVDPARFVYRCEYLRRPKRCVIHEFFPADPTDSKLRTRFLAAAGLLRQTMPRTLPAVVEHFAVRGRYYAVEECLEGETLFSRYGAQAVPIDTAETLFEGMLAALGELHALKPPVYHGNVNSRTVLLADGGTRIVLSEHRFLRDTVTGDAGNPQADIQASARVALELVSGAVGQRLIVRQALASLPVESGFATVLEWLLDSKRPPGSVAEIERFRSVLTEADGLLISGPMEQARKALADAFEMSGCARIQRRLRSLAPPPVPDAAPQPSGPVKPARKRPGAGRAEPDRAPATIPATRRETPPNGATVEAPTTPAPTLETVPTPEPVCPPVAPSSAPTESGGKPKSKVGLWWLVPIALALVVVILLSRSSQKSATANPPDTSLQIEPVEVSFDPSALTLRATLVFRNARIHPTTVRGQWYRNGQLVWAGEERRFPDSTGRLENPYRGALQPGTYTAKFIINRTVERQSAGFQYAAPGVVASPTVNGRSSVSPAASAASLRKASRLYEAGRYRDAIRACDEALRLDPKNQEARELKPRIEQVLRILNQ